MLDNLSQRLSKIVKTMRGQARLTEANTKEMLREVRLALLEADVALPVVKEVLSRIKEKAMGEEVVGNLNPGQALVGVVQRELTAIIGGDLPPEERSLNFRVQPSDSACRSAGRRQNNHCRQTRPLAGPRRKEESPYRFLRRVPSGGY